MTEAPAIRVRGLTKRFGDKTVVDGFDMEVPKGAIYGFLGPNGWGKTTTIRMMCGLLTPDAGEGTCLGLDILTQAQEIKEQVGYMTQNFSLYEDLTIRENLDFIARMFRMDSRRARVDAALAELGLADRGRQLAGTLSGGWKQRLALAACMLHEPELLLLDEPTAGVDPKARRDFWDEIRRLSAAGVTVLVSTHYMDEAVQCDFIAYIAYGKKLISGPAAEIPARIGLVTWRVDGPDSGGARSRAAGRTGGRAGGALRGGAARLRHRRHGARPGRRHVLGARTATVAQDRAGTRRSLHLSDGRRGRQFRPGAGGMISRARLAAVLAKEFVQMRRDRVTFGMMIGIPIMQLLLFGYAINTDPEHLPTLIEMDDDGPITRAVLSAMDDLGIFRLCRRRDQPRGRRSCPPRRHGQFRRRHPARVRAGRRARPLIPTSWSPPTHPIRPRPAPRPRRCRDRQHRHPADPDRPPAIHRAVTGAFRRDGAPPVQPGRQRPRPTSCRACWRSSCP